MTPRFWSNGLVPMAEILQGLLPTLGHKQVSPNWLLSRDGDRLIYAMYQSHYSAPRYKLPRQRLFMGPGEKLVLLHVSGLGAFCWRKFIDHSGQTGINNAIFINQTTILSSILILEAEQLAWGKWPQQRLYTYVNPKKIKSPNPGYCYKKAGWSLCDKTKGGLLVLEKLPNCGNFGAMTP